MRKLLSVVFKNKNRFLILLTLVSMFLLTFASQLEIFALGVITKKGPEGNDFFDKVLSHAKGVFSLDNFRNLAFFIIFVALFKAGTLFTNRFTIRLLAIRVSRDLRQRYFEHIQTLPMEFYQKHHMGSIASKVMGDSSLIAEAVNACLINFIQTPFTVLTTLTLCFLTSWRLSLIVFFGLPCILLPILFLAKRVKRISKQIQKNQERFSENLLDFLAGIQTVKVFAMEDFSLKKYRESNHLMAALEQKSARYDLSTRPVVHTIGMFFLATALLYGLYVLQMEVSEILFYCGLLYIFYEPIKKFAEENSHIQRGVAAAERMDEVMQQKPAIEDSAHARSLTAFNQEIRFENVWFRYGEEWVLKGLNLTISKGQTVAIVGPTGSGKSTLVQLLPRLYDVQQGSILIDGKPLSEFTIKTLREQIAFVPQKPFLFLDTVSANISYGKSYTPLEVKEAAIEAHADEFICKLPKGYETELAEAGKNLSGGQQQRLAIARALFKKASILVMDEATSSLDNVSEYHIKLSLKEHKGKMTQIIIAHRLSTIEDADKIVYIDNGEKIAEGTLEELLASCPPFNRMWQMMHQQKN